MPIEGKVSKIEQINIEVIQLDEALKDKRHDREALFSLFFERVKEILKGQNEK